MATEETNGVGVLRGQRHIPSKKKNPSNQPPPPPPLWDPDGQLYENNNVHGLYRSRGKAVIYVLRQRTTTDLDLG